MSQAERRRNVRMTPTPDMPAHVIRTLQAGISESLEIVDISTSGMAISPYGTKVEPGQSLGLKLVLPHTTLPVEVAVRWSARGVVGLEFVNLASETAVAIQRYVAELLERGGSAGG